MLKASYFLSATVVATILLATPVVLPISTASGVTKTENAELDMAIRKTNMAFEKSKADKAFINAVSSQNIPLVKSFLIKNGAPDAISSLRIAGKGSDAKGIVIHVVGSCCPLKLVITISF